MRDVMWIYLVFIFLPEAAWSRVPETNEHRSVNATTSSPKVYVPRYASFNLGSDGNLTCSSKPWSKTLYVIWRLELKNKTCKMSFTNDGLSEDTCEDGKSLQNTSSAQSYLHIPNFSMDDVGLYTCESVYAGGNENYKINVAITVPPNTSIWLDYKGNKMVAVCKTEGGNPAANISWSHTGNLLPVETQHGSDGFHTVESRLELPEGMDTQNLSCIIRHPSWEGERILKLDSNKAHFPWVGTLIVVVATLILLGSIVFAHKKLRLLRPCRQSHDSPSKTPPIEDAEEVEPYACYIQRVNSIYN